MSGLEVALAAARFAHYAALTLAFGSGLFPLYAWGEDRGVGERVGRRLARLPLACAVAVLVTGLAWFLAAAANMADDPAAAIDPTALASILTDMDFGKVWAARMAGSVLLVLAALSGPRSRGPLISVILSGALLASIAVTGHGPAAGPVHGLADAAHLLAAGAWLGALVPIAVLVRPDAAEDSGACARALVRFSRIATLTVGALILSGLVNAWVLVGTPSAMVTTAYGRVLLAKLTLFAAMLALAAANRWQLTPALAALAQNADPSGLLSRLRRQVLAEQALGLLILALVGVLGTLAPPASA